MRESQCAAFSHEVYWLPRKRILLLNVPPGPLTCTGPEVASEGTVVLISVEEMTVKVAGVPLKAMLVVPLRLFPRMVTDAPTLPDAGKVWMQAHWNTTVICVSIVTG